MNVHVTPQGGEPATPSSGIPGTPVAPDCRGLNFYDVDNSLRDLLPLYISADVLEHLEPHYRRMGALAGGRLDELALAADHNPPVLHSRDRFGRDQDWIEYHPAYREMEEIAFGDFQFHAMTHRPGVLGLAAPMPPVAKYIFQYLFVQAEFGIMCPISVTDTSVHVLRKYASPMLKERLLPRMLSDDLATLWKGAQFMTEKPGGSDVGTAEAIARQDGDTWRIWGDKWFCSHADAEVALLLARPEGAPAGTKGLGLFAMPRTLENGERNSYRIVRLKDKLGTRSMASGEIIMEGAIAYPVGRLDRGFKQMMDQVNLSRLSHGVRAAAMMRRCVNEAMVVARHRQAFGKQLVVHPLMRRQLMKLLVPTEQALSMFLATAKTMELADAGSKEAASALRILTGLLKFRTCRDNIPVATGSMEVRGGVGYIEEFAHTRLVRDAHIGVLWEGTSNINALDVVMRAVAKERSHLALKDWLSEKLGASNALPPAYAGQLDDAIGRAVALAERIAADPRSEPQSRIAATALYNATTAALLAWEGTQPGVDARRLLLSRFVLEHRLSPSDPLDPRSNAWEEQAIDLILSDGPVSLDKAQAVLAM